MKKNISWLLVFILMAAIFLLSSQNSTDSAVLSRELAQIFVDLLNKITGPIDVDFVLLKFTIRKLAHFCIYIALGFFVSNALKHTTSSRMKRVIITLIICILFAVSDELHQLLVPGRGALLTDVLTDMMGSLAGMLIFYKIKKLN
ncbi:MAG: VanZ family protein [Eubacteriaceae bacterium]|nr:VanZ family protein [Eubacteriaceae bacterium]